MVTRGTNRGFTLIELIVTVSILAILVTILIVAINPAEQLARARDSKRAGDLDAIRSAITLYVAQATSTVNLSGDVQVNGRCKGDTDGTDKPTIFVNTSGAPAITITNYPYLQSAVTQGIATTSLASSTMSTVTWMPALIGASSGGSTLEKVPLDPTNGNGSGTTYYYVYVCDVTGGTTRNFELNATFESTYFKTDLDLDGLDGGSDSAKYEIGTDPALDLL